MTAAPVKVATIGAGYFAQFHHAAWAAEPRAKLIAVCDQDSAKAQAYAERFGAASHYTDPAQMLARETPDLVDIITPPATHRTLIELCVGQRIPTICQKAFCQSLDEARKVTANAEAAGVPLIVHENFRFSPWFRTMKGMITDGALGSIYSATFRLRPGDGRGPEAYLARQPYFQKMPRFLVHETAIHFIDTYRYLFGEPVRLFADLRRLNPVIAGEDAGIIWFDFGTTRALFDGNRLADHAAPQRRFTMGEMWIDAKAGTLQLFGDGTMTLRRFGFNDHEPVSYPLKADEFAGGAVAALQAHVLDHLIDGAPLENPARDYLANLHVEEAVYRSAETGQAIAL